MATPIQRIFAQVHSPKGLPFPNTVSALTALGVIRYHVDYVSEAVTAYKTSTEEVERIAFPAPPRTISNAIWNMESVVSAIRNVQQGKTTYSEFAQECVEAGVCGYLAFLTGQNVLYYGSQGDVHVEWFPGVKTVENEGF